VKVSDGVLQIVLRVLTADEAGREPGLNLRGVIISSMGREVKTARTLEKGLMILSLFDDEHPSWTMTGISEATGMPMPTALRLARTLEKSRYLRHEAQNRSYELGPAIYRAASVPRAHSELIRVARPHLERLTELTTESTALGVWEHGESHIIDMILTPRPFKPANLAGTTIPGLAASCGRIAAAFAPESVLEAALAKGHPQMTEHTIIDPVQLREEIERIRRDRVAFGIETISIGVCAVSAPVFDSSGKVAASMAVVAPTERFGPVEMREHSAAVLRAVTLLSRELGWTGDWTGSSPARGAIGDR
jgi:IclR family pca regulon transcriptional regulator